MEKNKEIALVVAYYHSKFDLQACHNLGYKYFSEAFNEIGKILNVNPNTIKNMRDEFDPLFNNGRVGWYQRELSPSRKRVASAFGELSLEELNQVVFEMVTNPDFSSTLSGQEILDTLSKADKSVHERPGFYIIRGPTGKKAEELFMEYFRKYKLPIEGELIDTRELGCGYDFEIKAATTRLFVEVKGLDAESGGISFTAKEWIIASKENDNYLLVIVTNVFNNPQYLFISNPVNNLKPQKQIFTTVQIRWNISELSLRPFMKMQK